MLASQLKHEFDVYNQGVGATPAWTMTVMGYSNDYINVIRIDSSNKWLGEPHKSLMGKMWSIIVETKKPFQNLDTFRELIQAGFNIDVTPVSKGQNKGKEGIRIYSMKQEPNEEFIKLMNYLLEDKTSSYFDSVYEKLKDDGGVRNVSGIDYEEDATAFILNMCMTMPHAPHISTLSNLTKIWTCDFGGHPAMGYLFSFFPKTMCQNAIIFLVNMGENIRFIAVETDPFCDFCLCEYENGLHTNYGPVKWEDIPIRLNEIIGT